MRVLELSAAHAVFDREILHRLHEKVMPSTCASFGCSRRIMSEAVALRSSRGFRLIWMRPLLGVRLVPSTPMKDDKLATSGSCRMTRAKRLLPLRQRR